MLAFPSMLINAANSAGIKTPDNPDEYNAAEFPHFYVFCQLQLCKRMGDWQEHWRNARVIALVPDDEIRKISAAELVEKYGFSF